MAAQKLTAPKGTPAIPPGFLVKLMLMLGVSAPPPEPVFVKPDNWDELTPTERRNLRLESWAQGNGVKFASLEAEKRYKESVQLMLDVLAPDKKPSRVPVWTMTGVYAQRRVGLTPKSIFYDQHKEAALAHIKYHMDLQPDLSIFANMFPGKALDMLDYQVLEWPGGSLPAERSYQYNEVEFLKGDEYDQLLADPSDFMLRTVFPRMYKSLEGLKDFPRFSSGHYGFANIFLPFALPEVKKTIKLLQKAAEEVIAIMPALMAMMNGSDIQGYPGIYGTAAIAPFDDLSDVLRSTRGVMMDMYRQPENVVAACEMFKNFALANPAPPWGPSPLVFMPLHKGADRFMSKEQFETFYWPSFKALMLGLIEDGYIPAPFCEGGYNNRLEYLAEMPEGSCLWHFDQTDMKRASKVLEGKAAIMGNVPASLLNTGTPEEMTAYCKDLIETCGPKGNFILGSGCQIDEAKEENLVAMIDSVKKFVV